MIRKTGRVDSGDAYLDTDAMEKERGITIFSKPAEIVLPGGVPVTLLDTPGHADFSPEMERTLSVMDYAILVVSALDGVDGRLPVLWRLLSEWHVPTFFFVNKMDRPGMRKEELLSEIVHQFGNGCMDLGGIFREESGTGKTGRDSDTVSPEINLADPDMKLPKGLQEDIAVLDEKLLQSYLEGEHPVTMKDVRRLIRERKLFPVSFGSALKIQGIDEFLRVLSVCAEAPEYKPEFGARVFKIARDGGTRLTWIKVTGGILAAKSVLDIPSGTIPGAGEGTPDSNFFLRRKRATLSHSRALPEQRRVWDWEILPGAERRRSFCSRFFRARFFCRTERMCTMRSGISGRSRKKSRCFTSSMTPAENRFRRRSWAMCRPRSSDAWRMSASGFASNSAPAGFFTVRPSGTGQRVSVTLSLCATMRKYM